MSPVAINLLHPSTTHLPIGPRTRVGRRRPRVETGDRLSRIGRGKAHALIGGELIGSRAIVSRGGKLQKQGREHDGWAAKHGKGRKHISRATLMTKTEREGEKEENG